MPWFAWLIVAVFAINTVTVINSIGKRRDPTTPPVAVGVLVMNSLLVWGVIELAIR